MIEGDARRSNVIRDLNEIPDFATEDDEVAFWDTHVLSDKAWDQMESVPDDVLPPTRPRGKVIELLFTTEQFARIVALCQKRGTNPWTLLKGFVLERLAEEEQRDALPAKSGAS